MLLRFFCSESNRLQQILVHLSELTTKVTKNCMQIHWSKTVGTIFPASDKFLVFYIDINIIVKHNFYRDRKIFYMKNTLEKAI